MTTHEHETAARQRNRGTTHPTDAHAQRRGKGAAPGVLHHHNPARHHQRDILSTVEHIFTGLLVLVTIAVMWFAGYVVYRLYSDQR